MRPWSFLHSDGRQVGGCWFSAEGLVPGGFGEVEFFLEFGVFFLLVEPEVHISVSAQVHLLLHAGRFEGS